MKSASQVKSSQMSNELNVPGEIGYEEGGYLYFPYQMQGLEGRLLTLAETLGLKDTQEKAYKDMIRNNLYEFYREVKWVTGSQVSRIMKENVGLDDSTPRPTGR